ncbi:MAG: membrane-bound dehydrogenase domain-containing protein [Limisphaerales bacterium]|nr:MAG: membrane-bound dehydrogenase domain-containing protein [Limisphaerales bacterium]KAG0508237.1 MAG: membrane-bound dehydrogenase domain-containing protein [Limisphaerales bacterium]TXT51666.1 MAG: membrane-bound dehydrogenase domain-containing protein [Limisphaerales bacterium]
MKLNRLASAVAALAGLASLATAADPAPAPTHVPPSLFKLADPDLEISVWATSPMLKNPTNMDTDQFGRIWVAEGVRYRGQAKRQPEGDRIVVLQDTDGDGKADKSRTFVQEPFLQAPMGVAVIDNKVIVSMTPDLIVYTDVNRDAKFDPAVDKREVLLTGFNGRAHDHSLHSVTVGPDGQWYWNAGNCGAMFTDKSGKTFRIGSAYDPYYGRANPGDLGWNPREIAGSKSDDGQVWIGGFAARMNPDGSGVRIIGHNFRNSYEHTVTSFGDVFQNDNDDPPACRVAFMMEGGNAGFCSADGKRSWQADRRPGQSVPTAHWRQEDPGTMPSGDVYGGGSPTGIAFVEDSALGKKYRGLLLSCEPGRNTVFGYFPKPDGAGFKLERFDFLTSNPEGKFVGSDFIGGSTTVTRELHTLFRPSDVMVGADGAIYVADWFDPRVGGHATMDDTLGGTIYRIAPKGFKPKVPKTDLTTLDGAVAALKSPAVNVRGAAHYAVKTHGEKAVKTVAKLLKVEYSAVQARAVWLLSQLGPSGVKEVEALQKSKDDQLRLVAFRALRRNAEGSSRREEALITLAKTAAMDTSPAIRREAALALRDVPFAQCKAALLALARGFDGQDRTMLEAIGTGAKGKEAEFYAALAAERGLPGRSASAPTGTSGKPGTASTTDAAAGRSPALQWTPQFAWLAWRLHPPQAIPDFKDRAITPLLTDAQRKQALTAIAFNDTKPAADAMLDIAAKTDKAVRAEALWWLLHKKDSAWKEHGLAAALKERGIYDPDKIELTSITVPEPPKISQPLTAAAIARLKGDVARGAQIATACHACHRIGNDGAEYAPNLTGWASRQPLDVVVRSIAEPSADISHGFAGHELTLKDGTVIHGLILADADPVIIMSTGAITQTVPKNRIVSKKPLGRSLMLSAEQMGMGQQELADIVAFLRTK